MKQERLNLERPYSPECVEGEFCEPRLLGILGSLPYSPLESLVYLG
jgi:hypothetical protein